MLLRYPDGPTGVALLLLRLTAALILYPVFIALSDGHFNWWLAAIPSAILFFALLAGLGTRVAAGLLILMLAADLQTSAEQTTFLLLASVGSVGALRLLDRRPPFRSPGHSARRPVPRQGNERIACSGIPVRGSP
jgi:hypothetical protein